MTIKLHNVLFTVWVPYKNLKVKLEEELFGHTAEVVILKFLKPFPILLSADNSG